MPFTNLLRRAGYSGQSSRPPNGATGSSTRQTINGQNMYYGGGQWRPTPGQVYRNNNPGASPAPPPPQPSMPPPPPNGATGSATTQNVNGQNMYYGAGQWRLTPGQVHRNNNPVPAPIGQSQTSPGVIQQGLAEILQPPQSSGFSDPYEAWKAGGRQGTRPGGY